jgi:hypothetical protein
MSFLDSLESNLKNLESRDESRGARQHRQRDTARAQVQASAQYIEELRKGPYTAGLLKHATRLGFAARTKVNLVWIGNTLRLEARGRKLELRPTPAGVVAVFVEDGKEVRSTPLDLKGNPEVLAKEWVASLPPREAAAPVFPDDEETE